MSQSMSVDTARAILGVTSTTPMADVKVAHRALMLEWHPDKATQSKGVTADEANARFIRINHAYACITTWHGARTAHRRYAPRNQEPARDDVLLAERRDQEMRDARKSARQQATAQNRASAQARLERELARKRARELSAARVAVEDATDLGKVQRGCEKRTHRLERRVAALNAAAQHNPTDDNTRIIRKLTLACHASIRLAHKGYARRAASREKKHNAAHPEKMSAAQRYCNATFAHRTWWAENAQ
jgi:hypothetical protein